MVLIREIRPGDAAGLGRVHSRSWRLAYDGLLSARFLASLDEDDLAESWQRRLRAPDRRRSLLVAEKGGEVVGFSLFGPCSDEPDLAGFAGEMQMLYILPTAQRRGCGRQLMERSAAALAAVPLFWKVVWVVEANHAARAFYRRLGLAPDGARRTERVGGEPVSVIRYAGPLNPIRVAF
jgi:ribosomal protein S18 acetylase RimI-like enzyme